MDSFDFFNNEIVEVMRNPFGECDFKNNFNCVEACFGHYFVRLDGIDPETKFNNKTLKIAFCEKSNKTKSHIYIGAELDCQDKREDYIMQFKSKSPFYCNSGHALTITNVSLFFMITSILISL